MTIIIIGTNGFIGSNLLRLFRLKDFRTISVNSLDKSLIEINSKWFSEADVVINCIGSANVGFSYTNTRDDFTSNVGVVREILEILREKNFNHIKLINLSSAAVYGNPLRLPVKESDITQPLSPYGYHKIIAELLLKEYSQCFGFKSVSLRIFSAYGDGQKKLLLWDLHKKIQETNGKIILFGTGFESRDFIHVEDIAEQIILVIKNADFQGEAINIANGREVRVSDVVELYQKFYPYRFDYEFNGEVRLGDPLNWCADISIMNTWSYCTKVDLEYGIASYINSIFNGQ